MSLESRIKVFDELTSRFKCERPSALIALHRIPPDKFKKLITAVCIFMSKCLPDEKYCTTENEILSEFKKVRAKDRALIKNCTPNGLLVPKNHTILEYNAVVQAYADIINSLGINKLIHSYHVPLNVRYKDGELLQENLARHHPTEHIHTDSWAGESPASVTTMLPLMGDLERNYVQFYDPPETGFDEEWLKPLPSYIDGENIAKQYHQIDVPYERGTLLLADFATLHSSSRIAGSEPRVSIDTTFALRRPEEDEARAESNMHEWRKDERISPEDLFGIGRNKLFVFPDSIDQQVDSRGGFKHPTNLRIIDIL